MTRASQRARNAPAVAEMAPRIISVVIQSNLTLVGFLA